MFHPSCYVFLALVPLSQPKAAKDEPCPDVTIVVFRHHPGIIDTEERMAARERDAKVIREVPKGFLRAVKNEGGLGRGYELSIYACDLGRWKAFIDKLHKAEALKYYDHWGLDHNGYGLVPVR